MSDIIGRINDAAVWFARSATRHRISRERIRHVIANYQARFEQSPPEGIAGRSIRIVYLGQDADGRAIEVMAVEREGGGLLVIYAMPLREQYRPRYEEPGR